MQAIVFRGVRTVRVESRPEPELARPSDALVRVTCTAVCGSDLHVYHGRERGLDAGTVMGHEFVGEVVELGAEVEGLAVGQRVASPFTTSCGACFYCRRGLSCRCSAGQLFGWVAGASGLHGVQAGYARVPLAASTLVPVPAEVPDEEALLTGDVLATGTYCAERGEVSPETVVAVVGAGPVGLMAALAARERHAAEVFVLDRVPERLALAEAFGARPVHVLDEDPRAVLGRATEGRGADVVLEVVGSPEATRAAFELVRPGGTISAAGVHTEERLAFSPGEAYDKNLTYRAGRTPARRYMEPLLARLRGRPWGLGRLFCHRLPLAEGVRAYELFDRKLEGCTKVALTP